MNWNWGELLPNKTDEEVVRIQDSSVVAVQREKKMEIKNPCEMAIFLYYLSFYNYQIKKIAA
jgi:hypothetical protein